MVSEYRYGVWSTSWIYGNQRGAVLCPWMLVFSQTFWRYRVSQPVNRSISTPHCRPESQTFPKKVRESFHGDRSSMPSWIGDTGEKGVESREHNPVDGWILERNTASEAIPSSQPLFPQIYSLNLPHWDHSFWVLVFSVNVIWCLCGKTSHIRNIPSGSLWAC